jgi:PTS system nitrogen regulatory IIA component
MRLSELLVPEHVLLPFEAADKWQAIERLAQAAVASRRLAPNRLADVLAALQARERSMATGMADAIAIPHAAVEGIPEVLGLIAISKKGIPFGALDGQAAKILVCLVIPRDKKLLHIKTLAEIARLLSKAAVRDKLLQCETGEQVRGVVKSAEG